MNKLTLIVGPAGSGKTYMAEKLTAGKKSLWVYMESSIITHISAQLERKHEVIVVERGRIMTNNDIQDIVRLSDFTAIRHMCKEKLAVPPIIVTIQSTIEQLPQYFVERSGRFEIIAVNHTYATA